MANKRSMRQLGHQLKPNKYKARATYRDGFRFDSAKEARRYDELKILQRNGDVVMFIRQIPFHLPGNTKYVVDFQIFWLGGTVTFEDVKGMETQMFKLKKRQVEDLYPVEITVT